MTSIGFFSGSREAHTLSECAWQDCPTHNAECDPAYTPAMQWPRFANTAVLCSECMLAHFDEVSLNPDGSCRCCSSNHSRLTGGGAL